MPTPPAQVRTAQLSPEIRAGGTLVSRVFWELASRLQIPDAEALELIGYAGKIGASGKRPRFRLSSRQTRLATYLREIETALHAIGEQPGWLQRRNRSVPFSGRTPLEWITYRGVAGAAEVLQFLNRAVLRRSLR